MANYALNLTFQDTTNNRIIARTGGLVTVPGDVHQYFVTINVGTTEESIVIPADIVGGNGPELCFLQNEDTTNYIQIGKTAGDYFGRLQPNAESASVAMLPLDAGLTTLYVKANTAAADLTVWVGEA